jgi:hypothetical protein
MSGFHDALHNADSNSQSPYPLVRGGELDDFDRASGATHIPAGWYAAEIDRGELVRTKTEKLAYRLCLGVVDDPHVGFRVWRYLLIDTPAAANRAKAALAPLGLLRSADLSKPYPAPGQVVRVRVLLGLQNRPDGAPANDVIRFELVEDRVPAPNPNVIDPTALTENSPTATTEDHHVAE